MNSNISDNLHVVLCSPKYIPNIAFTARSMKNMGVRRLRIVSDSDIDFTEAKLIAVHADDVIDSVQVFDTLEEALTDISYALAFTARDRKKGEPSEFLRSCITELKEFLHIGKMAFVFGPEDTGLSNEDVALCHRNVRIPSSDAFPSLNLSHAVIVALYELAMSSATVVTSSRQPRITLEDEIKLQTSIQDALNRLHIKEDKGHAGWVQAVMLILKKRDMTVSEFNSLMGFFNSLK